MNQAKGMVGSAMREIERASKVAMAAIGALGATLSVAYFANLIKGAIEAQARMKDLAQEAGTTASAISRFEQPARLAGLSTESVAAAIFKMSKAAQEAKDPMSNAGQALAAIGIKTNDLKGLKPDEMFERVARALDGYSDGLTKNNIMQELFGKSGREMARVVKEVAEAQKLHATVTDEEAEAADKLQDQIELARMETEKFWRGLAADGVPTFYAMVKAFNEGKREAGLYEGAIRALAAAFSEGFLGMFGDPEKKRVAELSKEIADLEKKIAEGGKVLGIGVKDKSMIGGYITRVTQLKAELAGLQSFLETQNRAAPKAEEKKPEPAFNPEAARKAAEEIERLRKLDAKGWADYAEAVLRASDEEYLTLAKIAEKYWAEQDKMREDDLKGWVKYADEVFKAADEENLALARAMEDRTKAEQARWGGFIDGIEGAFRAGWDAFSGGAKNAAQVARDALKRILYDWLWQAMAKPFILNIVAGGANALGLSGLGSAATAASGGFGGLGSILSSAGSFFGGPELLAGAPTFLEGLGPMLSAAGPYVAAIAGVYALYQAFKDKGENWKGKLGFGSNANAYTSTGPFGVQGFEYLAGDDALNRQIQAFMGSTTGIDRQLAARMTPAQIAAISGRLTGAYSTRNDGQPAEFAFGKGDETAAAQLTLEFLQKKYGTIFDEIDTEFAAFIRGYSGKSEDLLKAIGEFAGLLDMLDATGIKGLNITTLRAFQKEGEELGATFARITQQYATFQDLYYTDAEKIGMVQEQVAKVFSDLGIAIPASNEEFRKLVEGLDLSTESGRKMFTALMGVAPAFNTITNAAAAAVTRFNSLAATLSPSFGASNARSVLEARVRTWMGLTPANGEAGGWNVENTIANIGTLVREGRIGEALTYAQSLGGNAVTVLNDMLEAYIAWTNAMQNAQGPVTGVGTAITGLADAAARAAEQMQGAKDGLWAFLQGLLVNDQLSPLDPMTQLGIAKRQFYEQLGLAQGGDIGAAQGLSGYISTLLNLGRGAFASGSGYVDLFNEITAAAAEFARPGGAGQLQADMYAEAVTSNDLLREVKAILLDIRDRGTADGETVAGAVEDAALSTSRR